MNIENEEFPSPLEQQLPSDQHSTPKQDERLEKQHLQDQQVLQLPPQDDLWWIDMILPYGETKLDDLAFDMATKANRLSSQLPMGVRRGVGDIVRLMNCYYAHGIAKRDIHPRDIDRARHDDFSNDREKRSRQCTSLAFIGVQRQIDYQDHPFETTDLRYLTWLHNEFYKHLSWEERGHSFQNHVPSQGVIPGELRTDTKGELPRALERFTQAYDKNKFSKVHQIVAIGAAHQRLLLTRPFYGYNGWLALLMSHSSLQRCGVGNSLWSAARGVALNLKEYDAYFPVNFQEAPSFLSPSKLMEFSEFFLAVCIRQIDFMISLLEPGALLGRLCVHVRGEEQAGNLREGSLQILREALLAGEVSRGRVGEIIGYGERTARNVISGLVQKGYLQSEKKSSPLVLAFPLDAIDWLFPKLYDIHIDS